ncbi:phage protein NinX family protein [Trabulsiella odontotermitis]|uniref:phage protein NinX family protein n=1 Tax=Trabulsiella odontotermitis TaxID=379893 RepID=UPI003AD7712A
MSKMMKVKVQDLTGVALDYAVDRAANSHKYSEQLSCIRVSNNSFNPSSSWNQCGVLITRYQISFSVLTGEVYASAELHEWPGSAYGESHLQAACRAIVVARIGEEIDVPVEFLKRSGQ